MGMEQKKNITKIWLPIHHPFVRFHRHRHHQKKSAHSFFHHHRLIDYFYPNLLVYKAALFTWLVPLAGIRSSRMALGDLHFDQQHDGFFRDRTQSRGPPPTLHANIYDYHLHRNQQRQQQQQHLDNDWTHRTSESQLSSFLGGTGQQPYAPK